MGMRREIHKGRSSCAKGSPQWRDGFVSRVLCFENRIQRDVDRLDFDDDARFLYSSAPSSPPSGARAVLFQAADSFLADAIGSNQSETWEGCIVSCTTVTTCSRNCSKSTSARRVELKASIVFCASY